MADTYINTRTIMGNQETFDALIAGELEELVEDGVTEIADYGLHKNKGIKKVKFPNLTSMSRLGIYKNENLEIIDIGKTINFTYGSFSQNRKLHSLILRGDNKSTVADGDLLNNSLIFYGYGGIFVPSDLVSTYKTSDFWKNFNIFSIEEYPKNNNDWSTISDSWSEIFANEANGTYSTKYFIGDTKKITIDNVDYYAQIVAFDADPLSDNSGNAKITWIFKQLYSSKHRMNDTRTSWPTSELRTWLANTILPLFPSDIKANIKEVIKTSYDYTTSADITSNDKLWIPSTHELNGNSTNSYETSGPTYLNVGFYLTRKYTPNTNQLTDWWLRTQSNDGRFHYVLQNGITYSGDVTNEKGICLGFCT